MTLNHATQLKLGIAVKGVEPAVFEQSITGSARVINAQTIVNVMADLGRAEAVARASEAAVKRARDLFNTERSVSAQALEAAERQAAVDAAQLQKAQAQAALSFGAKAPWLTLNRREQLVAELERGSVVVVSASFPSGLAGLKPARLDVHRIGRGSGAEEWTTKEFWFGPADPSIPGPCVLGLIGDPNGLACGERLVATFATSETLSGFMIPASAVVFSGGEAWCYVSATGGQFARKHIDLDRPLPGGYFQAAGFGMQRIVVAGAGLLLAYETSVGSQRD